MDNFRVRPTLQPKDTLPTERCTERDFSLQKTQSWRSRRLQVPIQTVQKGQPKGRSCQSCLPSPRVHSFVTCAVSLIIVYYALSHTILPVDHTNPLTKAMEGSLFFDRVSSHVPDTGFFLRVIFLGLFCAMSFGLGIPGIFLTIAAWKTSGSDSMFPAVLILPSALTCMICTIYLLIRWTRDQLREYRRVREAV